MASCPSVDVLVVTYFPEAQQLRRLFSSLTRQGTGSLDNLNCYLWDNSEATELRERVQGVAEAFQGSFNHMEILGDGINLGYGKGLNRLSAQSSAPWILILNQETELEPNALEELLRASRRDEQAAAWELRQIPYEHPKIYNPSTLETPWVSGAACLFRRTAFEEVGGFDPKIFMYGEDVDLSWRLRARGWVLRYVPRAGVVHRTYNEAREIKPRQVIEGTLTNLCLRARFGSLLDVSRGLLLLAGEVLAPESFPRRRKALAGNFLRFFKHFLYFRRSGRAQRRAFEPLFLGWDYAQYRDGAFCPFQSTSEKAGPFPLVSILVRTHSRPEVLREALNSITHQTYPHIEVIVVEDGPPTAEKLIEEEFSKVLDIQYYATGNRIGRSKCGNLALSKANGEWLNFLDDDDQLFADHIEVLLDAVQREDLLGAYGLAWEVTTQITSYEPFIYEELFHHTTYRQPFSRITLWHHNYMPIQAVLFHRSLYERYGGFEEDMEQLEDWNLWTRYTLEHDFCLVSKTTSKYRLNGDLREDRERQRKLDRAYSHAVDKQEEMQISLSPRQCLNMIEEFNNEQLILSVAKPDLRKYLYKIRLLRWLVGYRSLVLRGLRRVYSNLF